jgi:phosphatidylinositol 4-kinase B
LIDSKGHIIHIDFGFILTIAPGGITFENAPFKLTADYIQIMGGVDSGMYSYFKILIIQGFTAVRKYVDELCDILHIMKLESKLPCFEKYDEKVFRARFKPSMTDEEVYTLRGNFVNLI